VPATFADYETKMQEDYETKMQEEAIDDQYTVRWAISMLSSGLSCSRRWFPSSEHRLEAAAQSREEQQ